jgi:dienelactone hydrolase
MRFSGGAAIGAAPRLFLLCLCLLAAACGGGKAEAPGPWQELGDSLRYRTLPRAQAAPRRAQVLLLHGAGRGPEVWAGFAEQLAAAGHEVCVLDLPQQPTAGLAQRLRPLLSADAPPLCAVIGEGMGALTALEITTADDRIGAAVLLSPPLQGGGVDGLAMMRAFDKCPVLLVATEDDLSAATAALQYKDTAPAFCEVQLYPGNAHGTDIFALKPTAMLMIGDWLRLILDKAESAPAN